MGAGIHGGFGNTYGKLSGAHKTGIRQVFESKLTREDFIRELTDKTEISNKIAIALKNKDFGLNVLEDNFFEEYLGLGPDTIAYQKGKQIYLRRSSANIVSDLVHEGNHALEYLSGISPYETGSRKGEIRAYKAEREFQIKTNRPVEFQNEDDIIVHVMMHYK